MQDVKSFNCGSGNTFMKELYWSNKGGARGERLNVIHVE